MDLKQQYIRILKLPEVDRFLKLQSISNNDQKVFTQLVTEKLSEVYQPEAYSIPRLHNLRNTDLPHCNNYLLNYSSGETVNGCLFKYTEYMKEQDPEFKEIINLFKGFFQSFYGREFLKAEMFLIKIREKYKTVECNKAIMAFMNGNKSPLVTFLSKKLPRHKDLFIESNRGYILSFNNIIPKPDNSVDLGYQFNRLPHKEVMEYWSFLQALVDPVEFPETLGLIKIFFLNVLKKLNAGYGRTVIGTTEVSESAALIKEVFEFVQESFVELVEGKDQRKIKRFSKNLNLTSADNKLIFSILKQLFDSRSPVADEVAYVVSTWMRLYSKDLTPDKLCLYLIGQGSSNNASIAKKQIEAFFRFRNHFGFILKDFETDISATHSIDPEFEKLVAQHEELMNR